MKKFILNSLFFAALIPLVLHLKPLYLLYNNGYQKTVAGNEIYYSIAKSRLKNTAKKLVLGDSVGKQLFSNTTNTDTVNSLACNQSIAVVGQYLLLHNYLAAGNAIDTLYLFFNPLSFSNNLDQEYTYHYFLKPFYNKEYSPLFTPTVMSQINKIKYHSICTTPYILTSNWAPDFTKASGNTTTLLSSISVEYLIKIKTLATQHKFKFIIVPTPVSYTTKAIVDKLTTTEIVQNNLTTEFATYFNTMPCLADSLFSDGTHLKNPSKYIQVYYQKFYSGNF